MPGAESGWCLLSSEKGGTPLAEGADPGALVGRRADVVVGLPAAMTSVFSVRLPQVDASLYESMLLSQAEKRGLPVAGDGAGFDFEPIRWNGGGNTGLAEADGVGFAAVATLSPPSELLLPTASGYQTTAALRRVEGGGTRLWREHGRLVFAAYDAAGTPLHVQILSGTGRLDEAAGREVSLVLLGLGGEPALDRFSEMSGSPLLLSLSPREDDDEEGFARGAGVRVAKDPAGTNALAGAGWRERLLPAEVARARRRHHRRRAALLVSVVVLALYGVGISWLTVHSKKRQAEIASLQRQVAILAPDVERIQQMERRWRTLEPAFEKSWFPMVQLNRITSALPGSGVVLRDFRTSGRDIRVRGQARDVQFANRLLEDLRAMEEFSSYEWNMPNPRVESNNTASFEIEGKPRDAGAES